MAWTISMRNGVLLLNGEPTTVDALEVRAIRSGGDVGIVPALRSWDPPKASMGALIDLRSDPPKAPMIMLIEDDVMVRRALWRALDDRGYVVNDATNGKEATVFLKAISAYARVRPDLIICDLEMPEMDGQAVLDWRSKDAYMKKVPFLLFSGSPKAKDVAWFHDVVWCDKSTKPSDFMEIVKRMMLTKEST